MEEKPLFERSLFQPPHRLADTGLPVSIGGARLTRTVGGQHRGARHPDGPRVWQGGRQFLVGRYSREVFSRSRVGALTRNLQVSSYLAKTATLDRHGTATGVELN